MHLRPATLALGLLADIVPPQAWANCCWALWPSCPLVPRTMVEMWEQPLIPQGQIDPHNSWPSLVFQDSWSHQFPAKNVVYFVSAISYISISLARGLVILKSFVYIFVNPPLPHTLHWKILCSVTYILEQNMPVIYFSQLFIEWPLSARLYAKGLIQSYEREQYRLCPIEAILLEKETSSQITNLRD